MVRPVGATPLIPCICCLCECDDDTYIFAPVPLQEYRVRDFQEACELLNWGLENRRMGRTAMNFTSSRSHTVLTVKVEQQGTAGSRVRVCHHCPRPSRVGAAVC